MEALGILAGKVVTNQNVQEVRQNPRIRNVVQSLQVANDAAERDVALIQRLKARTKDEYQKQFLFKVVHHDYKTVKKVE